MHAIRVLVINEQQNDELSLFIKNKLLPDQDYNIVLVKNTGLALEKFSESSFDVVIVKAEAKEPGAFFKELKNNDPDICIIAFLEEYNEALVHELSNAGAYEAVSAPINDERFIFLIKKGAELHSVMLSNRKLMQSLHENNISLQKQNVLLANRIEDSTKNLTRLYEDLRTTYMRTIKALAQAIDARDHYTHSHSESVAKYAAAIAEELHLSAKDIELIREACELHDLGKIGVQDNILVKPSSLNEQEWAEMKKHPITGAQILEPLTFLSGVTDLIRQHHEHYDGSGYPAGLSGDDILLGARIIHLADAYEAMRSARSYRKTPLTKQEAIIEIKNYSGTQFDPKIVKAFLQVVDELDKG
ncbi:MAG: HD domain-containing protein [Candidatus Omnitrophica bacterium]|nr:HD domain-containing protein [Candidatus Omnitrophota bacterium]